MTTTASTSERPGVVLESSSGESKQRLLALTWAHLLNDGAANYLPGVLPAVLVAVDEPIRLAGVLVAALTIGQAFQPAAGWIADRVGGRWMVALGLFMSSLGGALLGVTHSLGVLIVLLLLIGFGSAFFHPQALAGVRSMLRGRQGLFTSLFLVGGELGRGVWPTAASLVAANLGLSYLWIIAIPGLATVALVFRMAPKLPPSRGTRAAIRWKEHRRPLALLLSYRGVRALTTYGVVTFIPILWHLRGGSLVSGASIITTIIVAGVVGNVFGGHLADRFGRRLVLVLSAAATAALILPVAYLSGAAVWIAAGLLGPALFLTASTTVLIGQDIFPENRSMGSGIALGLGNGIGAVLVLLVGFLVSDVDVTAVFWALAGLSLAAVLPALAFPKALVR
ncbi:MAG TPA: MFS transporter [Acidimicrobiales bacterium]|nr:MFS transporter [Acidimicrobiales bacterium]